MALAVDDAEGQARVKAFEQGLKELGWSVERNVRIDYRWAAGNTNRYRTYAAELLALAPDVVVAAGSAAQRSAAQLWGHCRHPTACLSCSCRLATPWARASSKVLRALAETPLDFLFLNTASAPNGWNGRRPDFLRTR